MKMLPLVGTCAKSDGARMSADTTVPINVRMGNFSGHFSLDAEVSARVCPITANRQFRIAIANCQCHALLTSVVLAAAALTPVVVLLLEASTLAEAPLAALAVAVVALESFVLGRRRWRGWFRLRR